MTTIKTINPATGETFTNYQEMTDADARDVVGRTHDAYLAWRRTSFGSRAAVMRQAAKVLRDNAGKYAELMAREMGKPIRDGVAEIQKCAGACDYYAENAERFLATEPIKTEARKSYVIFQPLGVVLAVMPWNFPFWQVFRFAAPGLMAGNGAVMKLSSNVPGCAIAIEEVFREAGFPEHLFRSLVIGSAKVETVIENPLVRAATLTGSGAAGRAVAGKAGSLLKKTVLELGGSDPYLVLEDADLDLAATVCARGRLINSGQSCIAAKRFIVVDKVQDRFVERFVERMAAAKMGDPLSQDSEIGPQARHDLRDALHQQVENSAATVRAACSAVRSPNDPGAYYPPTVLTNVRKGMPAYDEELFGPVASVIRIDNEDAAIATANDSILGLSGGIITRDIARGERIAAEIESGCVFVNDNVRSDPRLPFGGVKESGYGRELSHYGIKEFVNIKTIVVS